jgi:chloramphenicol 3-O-phosphotransferase
MELRVPARERWREPSRHRSIFGMIADLAGEGNDVIYDVEVDTASSSIEQCVEAIRSRISGGQPQAFRALRASRRR